MLPILFAALSMLGQSPADLNLPSSFWCQDFVSAAIQDANHSGGGNSPNNVMNSLIPTESPIPGAIVAIDLFPGNDTTEHVAIVESTNSDGSINTIEGNGPDENEVVRHIRQPIEIISYAVTQESHNIYLNDLCTQLQDVKPWINWNCESF